MAISQSRADYNVPPEAVYAVVADPGRLPEWDVSYSETTPLPVEAGQPPRFVAHRMLANREMRLVCRIEEAEPPTHVLYVCDGDAGELVREDIVLTAAGGGTGTGI